MTTVRKKCHNMSLCTRRANTHRRVVRPVIHVLLGMQQLHCPVIHALLGMQQPHCSGRLLILEYGVDDCICRYCGGRRALAAAAERGLVSWVGCMVGSGANSGGAACLLPHVTSGYCDLDGALLVTDDSTVRESGFAGCSEWTVRTSDGRMGAVVATGSAAE